VGHKTLTQSINQFVQFFFDIAWTLKCVNPIGYAAADWRYVLLGEASGRQKKSADVATEQVVICEKKSPDGTTYSVTVDQLKKCLAQVRD